MDSVQKHEVHMVPPGLITKAAALALGALALPAFAQPAAAPAPFPVSITVDAAAELRGERRGQRRTGARNRMLRRGDHAVEAERHGRERKPHPPVPPPDP